MDKESTNNSRTINIFVRDAKECHVYLHECSGEYSENNQEATSCEPPRREQKMSFLLWDELKQAVSITTQQGYWWSSRSWSVVYRVSQIKGYKGGFSDFTREVADWGIQSAFSCSYDAVQKPISKGLLVGNPNVWTSNGAPKPFATLGTALLLELDKLIV